MAALSRSSLRSRGGKWSETRDGEGCMVSIGWVLFHRDNGLGQTGNPHGVGFQRHVLGARWENSTPRGLLTRGNDMIMWKMSC